MTGVFGALTAVRALPSEHDDLRPGDDLVAPADVVMDRAFTVPGAPDEVWPWIVQLGKRRAGWYFPRAVERLIPRRRRALRSLDSRYTHLAAGDVIPDYGGRDETFTVADIVTNEHVVYRSRRGTVNVSWSIVLRPLPSPPGGPAATRVLLRLRLAPVRRVWLARTAGELVDLLTIAGMAQGLIERLGTAPIAPSSGPSPGRVG